MLIAAIFVVAVGALGCDEETQPDSLVRVWTGLKYRENIDQNGNPLPTPVIKEEIAELQTSAGAISITYRREIDVRAGQNAYVIFSISSPFKEQPLTVDVSPSGLPQGIVSRVADRWAETAPGDACGALQLSTSRKTPPGQYSVLFGVNINGQDCGAVPCTLKVTP